MYKWDPYDYHVSSSAQRIWAQELIKKLNLKGTERILDVGCGDGKITVEMADLLPKGSVIGIDNSQEMIEFAIHNYGHIPNVKFKTMDAKNMTFNQEFDIVFSNACLHWVIDHLPVLKGIKQSLKPSSKVLLQMGGFGNAKEILAVINMLMLKEKWQQYFVNFNSPFGFYNVEQYQKWLDIVGLIALNINLVKKDMIQKGKEGLASWIRTTWMPYLERIPQELQKEFIETIVEKYISKYPVDNNGDIHVLMVRLEVEAFNA